VGSSRTLGGSLGLFYVPHLAGTQPRGQEAGRDLGPSPIGLFRVFLLRFVCAGRYVPLVNQRRSKVPLQRVDPAPLLATGEGCSTVKVTGKVTSVDHRVGDFVPTGQTEAVPYDFYLVAVNNGDEVVTLKCQTRDGIPPWKKGDVIEVEVAVPSSWRWPFNVNEHLGATVASGATRPRPVSATG
jgi:hypothetical protein